MLDQFEDTVRKPGHSSYAPDLQAYLQVCERNYRLIVKVIANRHEEEDADCVVPVVLHSGETAQWSLSLLENTPYTTLIKLCQEPALLPFVSRYEWLIRLYHDATMAEVVTFQGQRPLKPAETLSNPNCHYKDEKNQANVFLNQWLTHFAL